MMKSVKAYWLVCLSLVLLMACGEDRTYEYEEKTQHNKWIRDMMLEHYLWADSIADYEPTWKQFFSKPAAFLSLLTSKSGHDDKWSYVEVDTLGEDPHQRGYFNHVESYGMDFLLMTDPTGLTTKQVLRVLTVYKNSPAERAGLHRNDFICTYNGYKITSSNVSRLQKGVARTLEVRHLAVNEEDGYYWKDTVTVSMGASEYVEDVAFPVNNIIHAGDAVVGYLLCTRLTEGPVEEQVESHGQYQQALDAIMAQMRSAGVTEMVLDLRLCNYGTIDMAQRLASYVVRPDALGDTFVKTIWNNNHSDQNKAFSYDTSVGNLGLNRIYILTGTYTQGAAEWLIHALEHSMGEDNVIVLGTPTKGQNVMTSEVWHDFYVRLCPSVAYVADGGGDYEYGSIEPMLEIDELAFLELAEYGDPNETLFYYALKYIVNGNVEEEDSQNDSDLDEDSDKTADE